MRRMLIAAVLAAGLVGPAMAQGTLRVAVGSTLNNLDPAKTTIGDEYIFVHLVFNGLTRIDRDAGGPRRPIVMIHLLKRRP